MNQTSSAQPAEVVHRLFLGSAEVGKWARAGSFFLECVAALVAGWRALDPALAWPAWASLLIGAVLLAAFGLRLWSKAIYSFAERCRRIAIRAYSFSTPVTGATQTSLMAEAPLGASRFAAGLPTQSLDDYYEAARAPGYGRLRELYAHSSFYSWRLFSVCWRLYLLLTVVFFAVGGLIIYGLAASHVDASLADKVLDMVCSVVVVFFVARAFEAFLDARSTAKESKRIADAILNATNEKTLELAEDYDVERAGGRAIPTAIYMRLRDKLQSEWMIRKEDLRG